MSTDLNDQLSGFLYYIDNLMTYVVTHRHKTNDFTLKNFEVEYAKDI